MNKQDLIDKGYKHVCTQNSESKIELWAKFNGYKDTVVYLYYSPKMDMVLEQTRQVISYTQLDMMAQMRDKNRIPEFTKELERIWMQCYPDLRFGQLMMNFLNYVALEHKRDPFFPEESEMLKYLKEYAKKSPYYKENK